MQPLEWKLLAHKHLSMLVSPQIVGLFFTSISPAPHQVHARSSRHKQWLCNDAPIQRHVSSPLPATCSSIALTLKTSSPSANWILSASSRLPEFTPDRSVSHRHHDLSTHPYHHHHLQYSPSSLSASCTKAYTSPVPPIGVFMIAGCGADLLINIALTILGKLCFGTHVVRRLTALGYFPGHIHVSWNHWRDLRWRQEILTSDIGLLSRVRLLQAQGGVGPGRLRQ
jgi:uncharacterized membrane protein YqaE (UPF0057 family)